MVEQFSNNRKNIKPGSGIVPFFVITFSFFYWEILLPFAVQDLKCVGKMMVLISTGSNVRGVLISFLLELYELNIF